MAARNPVATRATFEGDGPLSARERADALALLTGGQRGIRDALRGLGRRLGVREGKGGLARFQAALLRAVGGASEPEGKGASRATHHRSSGGGSGGDVGGGDGDAKRERQPTARLPDAASATAALVSVAESAEDGPSRQKRVRGAAERPGPDRATVSLRSTASAASSLLALPPGVLAGALRYLTEGEAARTDAATRPREQRAPGTRVGAAMGAAREVLAGGCRKTTRCGALCGKIVADAGRYRALDPTCRRACWESVSLWLVRGLARWDDPRQPELVRGAQAYDSADWHRYAGAPSYRPAFAADAASPVEWAASADRVYTAPAPGDPKQAGPESFAAIRKPAADFAHTTYVGGVGCDRHSFYIDLGVLRLNAEQLASRLLQLVPQRAESASEWTYQLATTLRTVGERANRVVELTRYYGRAAVIDVLVPEVRNPSLQRLARDVVETIGHRRLSMFAYESPEQEAKEDERALEGRGVAVHAVLQASYVEESRYGESNRSGDHHPIYWHAERVPDIRTTTALTPVLAPWLRSGLLEHWLQLGQAPVRVKGETLSMVRLREVPIEGCEHREAVSRASAYASWYVYPDIVELDKQPQALRPLLVPVDAVERDATDEP